MTTLSTDRPADVTPTDSGPLSAARHPVHPRAHRAAGAPVSSRATAGSWA